MPGYSAFGNRIHTGKIRIGRNAYVGEQTVLDIGVSIGDFGQLGHASSLQSGQRIPAGKRYHGSPAEETTTNFRLMDETSITPLRRWLFAATRLAFVIAIATALIEAAVIYALAALAAGEDFVASSPWDAALSLAPDGRGRRARPLSDCARRRAGAHLRPASARQPLSGRGPGLPALWLPSRHA